MNELMIRYAKAKDLENVYEIEKECFPVEEASSMTAFDERIRLFPEGLLVGEVNGETIGFISGIATNGDHIQDEYFESMEDHEMHGNTLNVLSVAVSRNHQGKGYATELMNAFIGEAKSQGRKKIVLTCKEYLVQYYKKFGFVEEGISESKLGGAQWYDLYKDL